MATSFPHRAGSRHTGPVPEILEVELYRRSVTDLVGRRIVQVRCPDAWYIRRAGTVGVVTATLEGAEIVGVRRLGKLLMLQCRSPDLTIVVGLRFGMTGRPLIDRRAAPLSLEYASNEVDESWIRFALVFDGGGMLRICDPRRLGSVEFDPDLAKLGPDAFELTDVELVRALRSSRAIKAVLLDQSCIAGLGNMLVDEVLWRAAIDPARPAGSITAAECRGLVHTIRIVLPELLDRGGSHVGDLAVGLRRVGALCPIDGAPLSRRQIGGRSTYSCPTHQH